MPSTQKKSSAPKKQAAARAPQSNGSSKTTMPTQTKTVADSAVSQREKREAKIVHMSTKEVTLQAFRRTYDRLHPRKDK